jgi:hypothetical protein
MEDAKRFVRTLGRPRRCSNLRNAVNRAGTYFVRASLEICNTNVWLYLLPRDFEKVRLASQNPECQVNRGNAQG